MTAASPQGSVAAMRRHGDVPSSFYVPSPNGEVEGGKSKKTWGERLKLGAKSPSPSTQESGYLLQEYRNKYGTLSNGSALSKSMKYAETWLYGSVAVRGPPPTTNSGVLLYPHPVAVIPATPLCSCPGTKKSSSSSVCKKCGGSRMSWPGGTVRGTTAVIGGTVRGAVVAGSMRGTALRLGSSQSRVRPSLFNIPSAQQGVPPAPDPYDLMRRNRLGSNSEVHFGRDSVRLRTRSSSPGRSVRKRRSSPSPSRSISNTQEDVLPRRPNSIAFLNQSTVWDQQDEEDDEKSGVGKRKSILECDVTAYELINKYLKNGATRRSRSPSTGAQGIVSSDDDILDEDDLSDNLSDNALLEDTKPHRTIRSKTKNDFPSRFNNRGNEDTEEVQSPHKTQGVTIAGQRIRIFSDTSASSVENNEENASKKLDRFRDNSMTVPRMPSPQRPPRRSKSSSDVSALARSESEGISCQIPNGIRESPTTLQHSKDSRIAPVTKLEPPVSVIKSILKKPSNSPSLSSSTISSTQSDATLNTFGDPVSPIESMAACSSSPIPDKVNSPVSEFYLPTFQEYRQRRKKQVQFCDTTQDIPVSRAVEEEIVERSTPTPSFSKEDNKKPGVPKRQAPAKSAKKTSETREVTEHQKKDKPGKGMRFEGMGKSEVKDKKNNVNSVGAEQVQCTAVDRCGQDANTTGNVEEKKLGETKEEVKIEEHMEGKDEGERSPTSATSTGQTGVKQLFRSGGHLRRSQSERGGSLRGVAERNISSRNSEEGPLFQDTMRLRHRPGRPDIRQVFSDPSSEGRPRRLQSPGRPRPKEPPPPPPPPSTPEVPSLPPRQIFPFTKRQIEEMNSQVKKTTSKRFGTEKKQAPSIPKEVEEEQTVDTPEDSDKPEVSQNDGVVTRREQRYSDPGPKVILRVDTTDAEKRLSSPASLDSSIAPVSEVGVEKVRTIVTVCPGSPDVHRLQVFAPETEDVANRSRKTSSILITGGNEGECNRVTISVGSVSPTSSFDSSEQVPKSSHSSLSMVIPVSPDPQPLPQKTLLVLESSGESTVSNVKYVNNNVTIVASDIAQEPCVMVCSGKSRGDIITPVLSDDSDVLMNPVEAVRRNLVPHVCGKVDDDSSTSAAIVLDDSEKMKEGDYLMSTPVSRVIEDSHLCSSAATEIKEEPQPSEEIEQIQESVSQSPIEPEQCETKETDQNVGETQNGESLDVAEEEVLAAPLSPDLENEGALESEDACEIGIGSTLSPAPKDATLEKGDPENEAENIYESIKDPIYEEIPDTPPPLPLSPPPCLEDLLDDDKRSSRSIFEGASKYDILNYLEGAKERGIAEEDLYYGLGREEIVEIVEILDGKPLAQEDDLHSHERMSSLDLGELSSRVSHLSNASDSSEDSCNLIINSMGESPSSPNKIRKSSAEIERNDSGVGSETSKSSRSRWQHCGPAGSIREDQQHLCEDCDQPVETQVTEGGVMFAPLVCRKCGKKRAERKEIIAEIVDTEIKYGRDLSIILDEFYRPMLVAGLLSPEQLSAIFLNVQELLEHSLALSEKLKDSLDIALDQGDEDLLTVNIGRLFLESAPMLHTFESYCVRQGAASLLLANLEKEKELLRIFLRVSQMENAVLRRMNLNSFLMVPVQRVTKYPLLLARLHKVTPSHHEGRELLRQAQHKIELHLEHMNAEAKDISTTKLWRRISIMNGRRSSSETDMINIKLRKMAIDILDWNHDEVKFVMEGKLLYTNPADNNWRKARTIKLNPINALLVTNGKPKEDLQLDPTEDMLMFPRKTGVREATLLLLKEKGGRYTPLREPLYLDKCIVCCETDGEDYFEVQELASKDTFIFKAEDGERTKLWYRQLQYHAQGLGAWRRRRNALANIMINGMLTRN